MKKSEFVYEQQQMDAISNQIVDMVMDGASDNELAQVIKDSINVIQNIRQQRTTN